MNTRTVLLRGLLALSIFMAPACRAKDPDANSSHKNIILISVDTLRADHVGLYGYSRATTPNIDKWFSDGIRYEYAYATDAATAPSVMSLLTGLLPQDHGTRLFFQLLSPDVPVLTDYLPENYQTAAFVSNMVLTDEAIGLANRFEHYDDYVDQKESVRSVFERSATDTTNAVLKWLAEKYDRERPLFLWVHYIDPHGPYRPPEQWRDHFESEARLKIQAQRVPSYMREEEIDDGNYYVDRYDAEIAYTDSEIDRLLTGYQEQNEVDDTLVILTADHGETLMEHEVWFSHTYHVYEELIRIPLLLRGPGVRSGTQDGLVSSLDIVPTVLRFVGVPLQETLTQVDLRMGAGLSAERIVFAEAHGFKGQWRAAIQQREKWIALVDGDGIVQNEPHFYSLDEDPSEKSPKTTDANVAALTALLSLINRDPDPGGTPKEYRKGKMLHGPKIAPDVDEAALEKLRSLGYID